MLKPASNAALTTSFLQLATILFLTEMTRSAFLLSFLPAYAASLNISIAMVGVAVSVHYVADTAIKLVAGYVLDRFPAQIVLHIFLLIGALGLGLSYFGKQPWMLISGAALLGIGASPLWLFVLSKVKEEQRGSQMGTIYTVWLASLGLGPVAINFVIDRGYALSFWLMLGFWCAGWLLASGWKFDYKPEASGDAIPMKEQWIHLRKRLGAMKPLVPGMILQTAAAGLLIPILPTFASNELNLSYSDYSFVLIAGGLFTVLFLIPMGRLADRWGYQWFLVAGFGGLALTLYLLRFSPNLTSTLLLAALLGLAYSSVLPAWNALMSHFVPSEQKATGWGVLSGIEGLGVMIGPIAGGLIASRFSESATISVSALLLLSIAVFYFLYPIRDYTAQLKEGNKVRLR